MYNIFCIQYLLFLIYLIYFISIGGDPKLGRDAILALMDAIETSIPTPVRETDKPFLMPVEDTLYVDILLLINDSLLILQLMYSIHTRLIHINELL